MPRNPRKYGGACKLLGLMMILTLTVSGCATGLTSEAPLVVFCEALDPLAKVHAGDLAREGTDALVTSGRALIAAFDAGCAA